MSSYISQEAQAILDGQWPRLPMMDFKNAELVSPVKEAVNAGYKILSETAVHECTMEKDNIAGIDCAWINPQDASTDSLILYIPGGGGIFGCPETHSSIAKAISYMTNYRLLSVDYPKAPEHTYPEPQNAIEAIYLNLVESNPSTPIYIVADSFGASLAINLILRVKAKGNKLPKAMALICPFVDFNQEGDSYTSLCGIDPGWDDADVIKAMTDAHIGSSSPSDPMLSVLKADLSGFPATFIQSASRDLILSDAIQLQRKMRSAGNKVDFDLWEGLWHDFQAYQSIPEALSAMTIVAEFIKQQE